MRSDQEWILDILSYFVSGMTAFLFLRVRKLPLRTYENVPYFYCHKLCLNDNLFSIYTGPVLPNSSVEEIGGVFNVILPTQNFYYDNSWWYLSG